MNPSELPILLTEFLLRSAIVIGFGFLLVAAARGLAPAARHRLWQAVLAASLTIPVLLFLPRLEVLPRLPVPLERVQPLTAGDASAMETSESTTSDHLVVNPITLAPTVPARAHEPKSMGSTSGSIAIVTSDWWAWMLVGVWALGAIILTGRTLLAAVFLRRIRRSRFAPPAAVLAGYERLRTTSGMKRSSELWMSPLVTSPFTFGVFHPQIMLPASVSEWSDELEMILLHEMEHARRGDGFAVFISRLFLALNWVNPLAWVALRQIESLREEACDLHVLNAGHSSVKYAETLFRQASVASSSPLLKACATAVAETGTIEHRVKMILNRKTDEKIHSAPVLSRLLAIVGAVSVFAVGLLGSKAEPSDEWLSSNRENFWQSELVAFDELLAKLVETGEVPGVGYFEGGTLRGSDSTATIAVNLRKFEGERAIPNGYRDLKPAKGTVQFNTDRWIKGESVRWEFELAKDAVVALEDLVLVPKSAGPFLDVITIGKDHATAPGLTAGTLVSVEGTVGSTVVCYHPKTARHPIFQVGLEDVVIVLTEASEDRDQTEPEKSRILAIYRKIVPGMSRVDVEKFMNVGRLPGEGAISLQQPDHMAVSYQLETERVSEFIGSPFMMATIQVNYDSDNKVIHKVLNHQHVEPGVYAIAAAEDTGVEALAWWKACRSGDLKATVEFTGDVLVVGERDGPHPDLSLKVLKGKADIERWIRDLAGDEKAGLKVESVVYLEGRNIPGGGTLPEQMPDCSYLVTIANSSIDDVLEIFVTYRMGGVPEFVGLFEVER